MKRSSEGSVWTVGLVPFQVRTLCLHSGGLSLSLQRNKLAAEFSKVKFTRKKNFSNMRCVRPGSLLQLQTWFMAMGCWRRRVGMRGAVKIQLARLGQQQTMKPTQHG